MNLKDISQVKDAGEAEQIAIDWQLSTSDQPMSYMDLAEYGYYFTQLAEKFDLKEVFEENGII